jgi:hypothetical protein
MNQARIWLVVKPTVGLPLFLGTVALIALLVHASILTHTDWFSSYWNGSAKPAAVPLARTAAPRMVAPAGLPVGTVYFEVDKSEKWVDGGDSITVVTTYLAAHAGAKASISGYHDPSGNAEHNQELAKARALVVRDALVANGIATERLLLEKPIETTGSGDARDARRVDITVIPE